MVGVHVCVRTFCGTSPLVCISLLCIKTLFFLQSNSHVELTRLPQNSKRYKFTELLLVFCSSSPTFKYSESVRCHRRRHTNALFMVKKCKFNFRLCSYSISLRPFVLIAANLLLVVNYYYCRIFFPLVSLSNDLFSFRAVRRRRCNCSSKIHCYTRDPIASQSINSDKSLNTVIEMHCVVFRRINFNFYTIIFGAFTSHTCWASAEAEATLRTRNKFKRNWIYLFIYERTFSWCIGKTDNMKS